MHWRDIDSASPALLLEVRKGELPSRPSFRPEWTPTRWRIVVGEEPQAWADDDAWYEDWTLFVRARPRRLVLDALDAALVRRCREEPSSLAWWRWWSRELVRHLSDAKVTPLFPGSWLAFPLATKEEPELPRSPADVRLPRTFTLPRFDAGDDWFEAAWTKVLPVRAWSPPDSARVKSWRKHARADTLPPVLVLYLEMLDRSLIVDGHDRLLAAALEKVPARAVALAPLRREKVAQFVDAERRELVMKNLAEAVADPKRKHRFDTKSLNATVLDLYREETWRLVQRTWRLRGGRARWAAEIRSELRALGREPDTSEVLAAAVRARGRRARP